MTARRDRGSATAELAVGLPALVVLLLAGLTAVSAVTTHLRCVGAARDAALAAARGEPGQAAAGRSAPPAATIRVTVHGDAVHVTVRAPVRPLGGLVPRLHVAASAVAAVEPGAPAATATGFGSGGQLPWRDGPAG
ncbi:MAG TPA: TadE family type IV pilus minor pilin [Micromonosporaceae bacterium]|nr:TadE family type IV pilus minor pilin [Micromonosporaceae bacterium]